MKGILNVLKPVGMTSHDVVNYVRRRFKISKVGHTGTLDPGACGVLPVCIGRATKIAQYVQDSSKIYRCEITFGSVSDTYDSYGNLTHIGDTRPTLQQLTESLEAFKGEIIQIPPMTSAIKVGGQKLYKLAHQGKTIEVPERKVTVYDIQVVDFSTNRAVMDINCSSGTYIRSICSDIGKALGCGAYMSFLIRLGVGHFRLDNGYTIEQLNDESFDLEKCLTPIDVVFQGYPIVSIDDHYVMKILNGQSITLTADILPNRIILLKSHDGDCVALAETANNNRCNPFKILV